jgi:hypothetical protein
MTRIEFGFIVLSKRELLIGLNVEIFDGANIYDEELYNEKVTEIKLGFLFFSIMLSISTLGEKIDMNDTKKFIEDIMEKNS